MGLLTISNNVGIWKPKKITSSQYQNIIYTFWENYNFETCLTNFVCFEPFGLFYFEDNDKFVAVNNLNGELIDLEFDTERECLNFLLDIKIDKNRNRVTNYSYIYRRDLIDSSFFQSVLTDDLKNLTYFIHKNGRIVELLDNCDDDVQYNEYFCNQCKSTFLVSTFPDVCPNCFNSSNIILERTNVNCDYYDSTVRIMKNFSLKLWEMTVWDNLLMNN